MRIEVQPKPDGMRHINLLFSAAAPDPEDAWVREQLTAMPIGPKRILQWEREGRPYQVWQYGECVLGEALYFIDRYKRVVDRLRTVCQAELEQAAGTHEETHALIGETARACVHNARLVMDASGAMTLHLDDDRLRQALQERLAQTQSPTR